MFSYQATAYRAGRPSGLAWVIERGEAALVGFVLQPKLIRKLGCERRVRVPWSRKARIVT